MTNHSLALAAYFSACSTVRAHSCARVATKCSTQTIRSFCLLRCSELSLDQRKDHDEQESDSDDVEVLDGSDDSDEGAAATNVPERSCDTQRSGPACAATTDPTAAMEVDDDRGETDAMEVDGTGEPRGAARPDVFYKHRTLLAESGELPEARPSAMIDRYREVAGSHAENAASRSSVTERCNGSAAVMVEMPAGVDEASVCRTDSPDCRLLVRSRAEACSGHAPLKSQPSPDSALSDCDTSQGTAFPTRDSSHELETDVAQLSPAARMAMDTRTAEQSVVKRGDGPPGFERARSDDPAHAVAASGTASSSGTADGKGLSLPIRSSSLSSETLETNSRASTSHSASNEKMTALPVTSVRSEPSVNRSDDAPPPLERPASNHTGFGGQHGPSVNRSDDAPPPLERPASTGFGGRQLVREVVVLSDSDEEVSSAAE